MKAQTLMNSLLAKGDCVAIEQGRLMIETAIGEPVPNKWLNEHRESLVIEILKKMSLDALSYTNYSTGQWPHPGITLQFESMLTSATPYTIFNACLTRDRDTRGGKKGSPLPQGQFRLAKGSHFKEFWANAGLSEPRRWSSLHDYMGKLKGILFDGSFVKEERLDTGTIRALSIPHQQLLFAYGLDYMPDNDQTISRQAPDNCQTTMPDKVSDPGPVIQGVQLNSTTGNINHGIRLKGNTGIRDNVIPLLTPKRPEDQTNDEWLADYDAAE